jgi:hypothetical protein
MKDMYCCFTRRSLALVATLGLLASIAAHGQDTDRRGRKYKAPPPTARIEVTILKDVNGKPIENAAVIFHPMQGEKDTGNMELKTNEDGKAIIDVLPLGDTVRLQVIARGFQTFGDDYKIDHDALAIEIRMKRPGEQYSIYKPHTAAELKGKSTTTSPATLPDPALKQRPDSDKDSSKTPPASPDPAPAPPAQPSQPQPK